MSDAPVRFVDLTDASVGSPARALSEDLIAAREHGAVDYDVEQGFERFRGLVVGLESGSGDGDGDGGVEGGGAGDAGTMGSVEPAGSGAEAGALAAQTLARGTATATTVATAGTWSLGAKAAIFATLTIGAVGVGVIATNPGEPDTSIGAHTAPTANAERPRELAPTADVAVRMPDAPVADDREATAPDMADPVAPSATGGPSSHASSAPKTAPNDAPDGKADAAIGAEMAHLSELRAIASATPARAVVLADEGHQRFPTGTFGQEREAIAISALARLGRTGDARARAEAFLAKHPESPFAESIRKAVGLTSPP